MGLINNAPPPIGDAIAQPLRKEYKPGTDPQEGQVSQPWADWFTNLMANQEKAAGRVASVNQTLFATPFGPEDMTNGSLSEGFYCIAYSLAVTDASGSGAQLDVTFSWLDHGVTRTFTSVTLDPTKPADFTSDCRPIHLDNLSPLNYETRFDGDKEYQLIVNLQELEA